MDIAYLLVAVALGRQHAATIKVPHSGERSQARAQLFGLPPTLTRRQAKTGSGAEQWAALGPCSRVKGNKNLKEKGALRGEQGAPGATRGNVAHLSSRREGTGSCMQTNAVNCIWFRAVRYIVAAMKTIGRKSRRSIARGTAIRWDTCRGS